METNLTESILSSTPNADISILDKFTSLISEYNIPWIPSSGGGNAWYVMSQLSEAKGADKEDYVKNWANLTTSEKEVSSESLAGKAFKLEGSNLANFKQNYLNVTGKSLGRVNSLWIGDWLHAYSYLVQGRAEAAKDFQSLGSVAIEQAAKAELNNVLQFPAVEEVTPQHLYRSGWKSEIDLAKDLIWASSYGTFTLKNERALKDYASSKCVTRRPDFIHHQVHRTKRAVITAIELKKDIIDLYDLVNTVEAKRYVSLLQEEFNTQYVNLVLVAPWGGVAEAKIKAREYCTEFIKVEILSVEEFTYFLLDKAAKYHQHDPKFLSKITTEDETLKKLLKHPSLTSNVVQLPKAKHQLAV